MKISGFSCNVTALWKFKQLRANAVEMWPGVTGALDFCGLLVSYCESMKFREIHLNFSKFIYISVKFSAISIKVHWANFHH